jgi:hypothetical protein
MMSESIAFAQRLKFGVAGIFWFLLILFGFLGFMVIWPWPKWIIAAILAAALLIAIPLYYLNRAFSAPDSRAPAAWSFSKIAAGLALALLAVIGFPIYYAAFLVGDRPNLLPQVVLTNGTKSVVFQGMVHVGSEPFYKSVVYDLEKALADGYTLYYEGVQPSPGEGDKWFSETLAGGGDLSANYKKLGEGCGLKFQLDYFNLLTADAKVHPDRHITADVNTLQMKNEFDRLIAADPAFAAAVATDKASTKTESSGSDPLTAGLAYVASGTEDQKKLGAVLCRGFFAWSLKLQGNKGVMDPVILDFRNRELAKRIQQDPPTKIYLTYGAAHLPGLLKELQALDPAWKVVSHKWIRGIAAPEEFTATLPLN